MARAPSRLPSPWLVLVPVLVLALLAVRAAHTEGQAARMRAAARADGAAERLVRAISTVAQEFAQGLPSPDEPVTSEAALDAARHLYPRWLSDPDGRPLDGTGDAAPRADEPSERFVTDALETAAGLGDDVAGLEARAAFLQVAATAAPSASARAALELAGRAASRGAGAEGPAQEDTHDLFERVAAGRLGLADPVRERVLDAVLRDDPDPAFHDARARWDALRDGVRRASEDGGAVVRLVPWSGDLTMVVFAPVTLAAGDARTPACLVGEVPATTVQERISREAGALVAEARLDSIELLAPDGSPAISVRPDVGSGADAALTDAWTPLPAPLEAWRVHAAARDDGASSALGTILLAAAVVAAGAVVWSVLALRRAAEEQARLAAERQTFLDHVAHEVRTPAGALLALGEELASGHVPPDRQAAYHAHLAAEARRLARLVEDTLDLSRLDSGRLVLDRRPADLRTIAAGGIEAAGATDRVVLRAPAEPVVVLADSPALRRVVRNLVDNALRHGGGAEPPEVSVSADGAVARVAVRDAGPGIAPEELPRVFDRFRRPPSATHEKKGVGLGLAISREIAQAHGGDVDAESAQGRGSTFTLRVPSAGGSRP